PLRHLPAERGDAGQARRAPAWPRHLARHAGCGGGCGPAFNRRCEGRARLPRRPRRLVCLTRREGGVKRPDSRHIRCGRASDTVISALMYVARFAVFFGAEWAFFYWIPWADCRPLADLPTAEIAVGEIPPEATCYTINHGAVVFHYYRSLNEAPTPY